MRKAIYEKKRCEVCGRISKTIAIIRTFNACKDCFEKLKNDNWIRQNNKKDIPNSILTMEDTRYSKELLAKRRKG